MTTSKNLPHAAHCCLSNAPCILGVNVQERKFFILDKFICKFKCSVLKFQRQAIETEADMITFTFDEAAVEA